MAKGRVKNAVGNNDNTTGGNGGIMGSGIFGMFGTTVHCKAEDNSMFCTLSKFVNVIIMVFFLCFVFYLIYIAFNYFRSGGKMFGGRKWRSR
jgi:hypothetical protein